MADPKKPFNRLKPFKRINNEKFIVQNAPDGFGKASGCKIPADFKDFDDEFIEHFLKNFPALNFINNLAKTARAAAKAVADALRQLAAATLVAAAVTAAAGLAGPAAVLAGIAALASGGVLIARMVETVADLIGTAISKSFARLGKRLLPRAIRNIPQWVPVRRTEGSDLVKPGEVVEVEGIATRSFGN